MLWHRARSHLAYAHERGIIHYTAACRCVPRMRTTRRHRAQSRDTRDARGAGTRISSMPAQTSAQTRLGGFPEIVTRRPVRPGAARARGAGR